jgi:hypothetical protein
MSEKNISVSTTGLGLINEKVDLIQEIATRSAFHPEQAAAVVREIRQITFKLKSLLNEEMCFEPEAAEDGPRGPGAA